MILLFTSDNCTWCDVLKEMLEEEWSFLGTCAPIHEIDIRHCTQLANVYGVLVLPTLVAGAQKLTGMPTSDDLHTFLIQALLTSAPSANKIDTASLFADVRAIRGTEAVQTTPPELVNS